MKYFVSVADRRVEVVLDGENVSVDGQAMEATLSASDGHAEIRVVIDGRPT